MIGLLAFALIACGVVAITAVADEETDAADGKKEYSKVFKTDAAETLDISTNESAFTIDPRIGTFEVRWTYQKADGGWEDLTLNNNFTIGDWTYKLENKGDGLYTLTMNTSQTSATAELHLKYMIELKPVEGAKTTTGTMEVVIKISKNGSILPDHVTGFFEFKVDTAISRAKGEIKAYATADESQPLNSSDYRWFAFELPAGVSLSADGYLSGIPKIAQAATPKIYAEDPFGNVKEYEINILIGERDENELPFFVHRGTIDGFDPSTAHPRPKVSAVQIGDDAYLVMLDSTATSKNAKVTAVSNTQPTYTQELTYTTKTITVGLSDVVYRFYELPTNLTGAYGIVITSDLNITNTTLYVLPQLDVVVAGIGVSSSSNANNGGGN